MRASTPADLLKYGRQYGYEYYRCEVHRKVHTPAGDNANAIFPTYLANCHLCDSLWGYCSDTRSSHHTTPSHTALHHTTPHHTTPHHTTPHHTTPHHTTPHHTALHHTTPHHTTPHHTTPHHTTPHRTAPHHTTPHHTTPHHTTPHHYTPHLSLKTAFLVYGSPVSADTSFPPVS